MLQLLNFFLLESLLFCPRDQERDPVLPFSLEAFVVFFFTCRSAGSLELMSVSHARG